ncbi:MAG: ATP-binding cassette domain-containing protein [Mycoplasmataceae bacterium]|nr:ATP-binding cassette domain-containing protein [Mycoplasmataceae bacterium]
MTTKNFIKLENVCKTYPNGFTAVKNINIAINKGEFVTLLGPSGCGKTTLLKMLAGFEAPTSGRIVVDGIDIKNLPINQRPTATVFQDYALFPNMSVYDNIAYGLKVMRKPLKNLTAQEKKQEDRIYNEAYKEANKHIAEIDKKINKLSALIEKEKEKMIADPKLAIVVDIKNQKALDNKINVLSNKMKKEFKNQKFQILKLSSSNRWKEIVHRWKKRFNNKPSLVEYNFNGLNNYQKQALELRQIFNYREELKDELHLLQDQCNKLDVERSYWQNFPELKWEQYKNHHTTRKLTKKEIDNRVRKAIEMVGLEGKEDNMPEDLSGGMQQRVALARAIVVEPQILLLDEPLSALDAKVRQQMQLELKRIHQELKLTFILVTHDQEEALFLSNKIVVMSKGKVEQIDSSKKVYNAPANEWVANFIGTANIIPAEYVGDCKVKINKITFGVKPTAFVQKYKVNSLINILIRPEDFVICPSKEGKIQGKVIQANYKGATFDLIVLWNDIKIKVQTTNHVHVGDSVGLTWNDEFVHCLPFNPNAKEMNKDAI